MEGRALRLTEENAAHRIDLGERASSPWLTLTNMAFESVAAAFSAADVALGRARRDLRHLDRLTFVLPNADAAPECYPEVAHAYANWLIWARMVGVAIDGAGRAAGKPEGFQEWWDAIAEVPVHAFFRAARNDALKQVADLVAGTPLRLDTGQTVAFFAFETGPFNGEPLVPRCQHYTEWLYDACVAPARERLWDWEGGRFLDGSEACARGVFWPARSLV
jgi:hypothetical protein